MWNWIWSTFPPCWNPEGYNPTCIHCIRLYMHGLCYTFIRTLYVSQRPIFSQWTGRQFLLHQFFAHTNASHSSFVPNATNLWNICTPQEAIVTSSFGILLKLILYIIYSYYYVDINCTCLVFPCMGTLCISSKYLCILCAFCV